MRSIVTFILLFTAWGTAQAGPVLNLFPSSGAIQGAPGDNIGWGFTLAPDPTLWISVITSFLLNETNPVLGSYTDSIGLQGGPVNAVLAPASGTWTEAFDFTSAQGVGSYAIDPSAVLGSTDSGTLDVQYEAFTADPNICGTCAVGVFDLTVPFSVQVAQAPEPITVWLTAAALLILGSRWRRRRGGVGDRPIASNGR
jgi:hypothetical protein